MAAVSQTSQQYADLSSHVYDPTIRPGVRPPGREETVDINGVQYKILEHYDNPRTNYQGTIYHRVDTGEIVVAHRGTEVDQGLGPLLKDAAITDGQMVLNRVNPQAQEAIELTRRAIERANIQGAEKGIVPEVTVTGHSLGGCLAQITAHHFGLKGETFNAYGAASLGLGIPKGGDAVINHVMASDFVSAASPHYGQVRMYASQKEVGTLIGAGYENNDRFVADVRSPATAHAALLGTHSMHNFTAVDGDGRQDRSILADPNARQRAEHYAPMFEKFREEQALVRGVATSVTTHLTPGAVGFDREDVLKTEPAGVRGQREGTALRETVVVPPLPGYLHEGQEPALPATNTAPANGLQRTPSDAVERLVIPPLPEYLRDADRTQSNADPARSAPQHAIEQLSPKDRAVFDQSLRLAQQYGLPPEQAQNAAMALTATAKADLSVQHVDRVAEANGRVFASFHPHGDKEPNFHVNMDLKQAGNVPMEDSLQRIAQAQQQQITQQQAQGLDNSTHGPKIA